VLGHAFFLQPGRHELQQTEYGKTETQDIKFLGQVQREDQQRYAQAAGKPCTAAFEELQR